MKIRDWLENHGIFWGTLQRQWRYFGPNIEPTPFGGGEKYVCFGFWWFHIYYDTGWRS